MPGCREKQIVCLTSGTNPLDKIQLGIENPINGTNKVFFSRYISQIEHNWCYMNPLILTPTIDVTKFGNEVRKRLEDDRRRPSS